MAYEIPFGDVCMLHLEGAIGDRSEGTDDGPKEGADSFLLFPTIFSAIMLSYSLLGSLEPREQLTGSSKVTKMTRTGPLPVAPPTNGGHRWLA